MKRIGELFDQHHQRLYRLALRMTSDSEAARDLVQETFLRMARAPDRVPVGDSGGEAWLVRTLVNLCRDLHRHHQVRERSAWHLAGFEQTVRSPESAVVARTTIDQAMRQLPARRRAVLVLHELEQRSVRDVAALLGVTRPTVRWHLSIGKKELARALRSSEGEKLS